MTRGWTTKNVPVIGVHQRPSSRAGSPYAHVYMPALSTNGSHSPRESTPTTSTTRIVAIVAGVRRRMPVIRAVRAGAVGAVMVPR